MVALAVVSTVGCASTAPTGTSEVGEVGEYLMRQRGPDLEAVLGYRYAAQSQGEEWLLLEVALTSPSTRDATIERDDIFVRTPDGKRIPLATQEEFGRAYGGMQAKIRQANIMRDPMDYFSPRRRPCQIQFFAAPGAAVTFDRVTVNDRRACTGKLFFKVPGGIQSGRWMLGIDLVETSIRIPFKI
jgi:hypothetical protein